MTTTNTTSNVSTTSVPVVKVFVKKIAKRQFKAGVKFSGQWVVASGKQGRTAVKSLETMLEKLGAPKANFQVIKVEANVPAQGPVNVSAEQSKVAANVPTEEQAKVQAEGSAKVPGLKLNSCYAWAIASSAAVAKILSNTGADAEIIKSERIVAYKVAYVAASRASIKGANESKVAKFEKDLAGLGREIAFLDAIKYNIEQSGMNVTF